MSEKKKKFISKNFQEVEKKKSETFDYEDEDWKRLEKWRPGRRNFA